MNVKIGIIAVPAQSAQGVCDTLVENGVLAILNLRPRTSGFLKTCLYRMKTWQFPLRCFQSILTKGFMIKNIILRGQKR